MSESSNWKRADKSDLLASADRLLENFTSTLRPGLQRLLRSWFFARDLKCDIWDFRIDCPTLNQLGLTNIDLKWLIHKGYITGRGTDSSSSVKSRRSTRRTKRKSDTDYVLTELGATMAIRLCMGQTYLESIAPTEVRHEEVGTVPHPHWNKRTRELSFGNQVVKRFRVPAVNQARILSAFEEEGWPPSILDPLPQSPNIDVKSRLHSAIRRLNDCQQQHLIIFFGNGNGDAVCWRWNSTSHS
jgi:hypothetical protein